MSFVVDETGLEYTYNGEVWVSEGQEIDLTHDHDDEYATIEYSDEKDAGLALRIDSLEHLTDGHEADLGGASWTWTTKCARVTSRRGRTIQVAAVGI